MAPSAVDDSYDNALAETVNGYHRAELARSPAPPALQEGRRRRATLFLELHVSLLGVPKRHVKGSQLLGEKTGSDRATVVVKGGGCEGG